MIDKSIVIQLIEERLTDDDLFLVSVDISSRNHIRIVLDGDQGINIERCMSVSRNVEHNLDREVEDFSLEVSSFGLNQALVMERQYLKYINKAVEVISVENQKTIGDLLVYTPEYIEISLKLSKKQIKEGVDALQRIPFSDIKEVKSVISFK